MRTLCGKSNTQKKAVHLLALQEESQSRALDRCRNRLYYRARHLSVLKGRPCTRLGLADDEAVLSNGTFLLLHHNLKTIMDILLNKWSHYVWVHNHTLSKMGLKCPCSISYLSNVLVMMLSCVTVKVSSKSNHRINFL